MLHISSVSVTVITTITATAADECSHENLQTKSNLSIYPKEKINSSSLRCEKTNLQTMQGGGKKSRGSHQNYVLVGARSILLDRTELAKDDCPKRRLIHDARVYYMM